MLEGLDDVPWGEMKHAYGVATDVPDRLRELARGSSDALSELFQSICHQGTVYEASAYAVPFLIELLSADEAPRAEILGLLQALATGASYHAVHKSYLRRSEQNTAETGRRIEREQGWVRSAHEAAVVGVPTYLGIVADDDAEIDERLWAAFVLSVCEGAADVTAPVLFDRLDHEPSALVRAAIFHALGALDRVTDPVFERGIADTDPLPRLITVLVGQRTRELTPALSSMLTDSAGTAMEALGELPPVLISGQPLDFVLGSMGPGWAAQTAVLASWLGHSDSALRTQACEACTGPIDAWRPAAARLLPSLIRCLGDDARDVRRSAAFAVCEIGRAATDAADALWALIEREDFAIDDGKSPANRAFVSLCRMQDPRAGAHLRDVLERLAPAPTGGWQRMLGVLLPTGSVTLPRSVTGVVDQLGPWPEGCLEPLVRLIPLVRDHKIPLISAVGRHGDAAAFAVPTLRRLLDECPRIVPRVLGTLGPLAADALGDMQRTLRHDDAYARVNAARAVWRIAGRADMAVPALRGELTSTAKGQARSHALEAIAELGPVAADLATLLPPLFEDDDDWVSCRAAIAYWHITRDAKRVVPVLVDRHLVCVPRGFEALACLTDVGPAALAALPALRAASTSDRRQAHSGTMGTAVDTDEAWRRQCEMAMRGIERPYRG